MAQHFPVLIPILPLAAAMITLIVSKIHKDLGKYLVIAALGTSFICSIGLLVQVLGSDEPIHYWMGNWAPPLGIEFVIDSVNAIILVAVAAVAFFVSI